MKHESLRFRQGAEMVRYALAGRWPGQRSIAQVNRAISRYEPDISDGGVLTILSEKSWCLMTPAGVYCRDYVGKFLRCPVRAAGAGGVFGNDDVSQFPEVAQLFSAGSYAV